MSLRATSLLAFLIALNAFGQTVRPGRFNPSYLAEMPLPDRVISEINGLNPIDTAARRMGAFQQLNKIITQMSSALGQRTPDEDRIRQEYLAARSRVQQTFDPRLLPDVDMYNDEPRLRDEILNRFFSPPLRNQLKTRQPAAGQQARLPNGSVAPGPAASVVDPDIAKARAAGVDTKVFGIPLGERLVLPTCGLLEIVSPAATCVMNRSLTGFANSIDAAKGDTETFDVNILLAKANCPNWMSNCGVGGNLDNGRLVSVTVWPDGPNVAAVVGKELRAKYGTRVSTQQRTITPNNGGAQFDVQDLHWEFPGLNVDYRVVDATIYKGLLRIETTPQHEIHKPRVVEQNKPKL